ncbi:TPA: hypothetical protein L3G43_003891 [Morganella morganii]|nr:hypothetical protein [Morganella morganii]
MNISDLDPIVQCEILRLAHNYAINRRELLSRDRRRPDNECEWYGKKITEATKKMVSLYEQTEPR